MPYPPSNQSFHPHPPQFEYRSKRALRAKRGDKVLNAMVTGGWELVSRVPESRDSRYDRVTFRRIKPATQPPSKGVRIVAAVVVGLAALLVTVAILAGGNSPTSTDQPVQTITPAAQTTTQAAPTTQAKADVMVPGLVGRPLNQAVDMLRRAGLTGVGHDCSGRERVVTAESNWFVVSQDQSPGKYVPADSEVWLCSLKFDDR